MEYSLFQDIPEQSKSMKHLIKPIPMQKIYSKFSFLYFLSIQINDIILIKNFLYDYLKKYKFITYKIFDLPNKDNSNDYYVDITICIEGQCLIIEQIQHRIISEIIRDLEKQISIINVNTNDLNIHDEIHNFCSKFSKSNKFIEKTISPIVCYLIRRFFYPTNYFKDPSFFFFDQKQYKKEFKMKSKIEGFFLSDKNQENKVAYEQLTGIIKESYLDNYKCNNIYLEFKKEDFIYLRTLSSGNNKLFSLAFHIESCYIFICR